ncbi:MAG: ribosome biogenesis GTPase Der [Candidatus Latescibacteria bacterium]|nr:ribosome biogenesis GTPase Der [Candidatus Latescibacterota bacterium]
MSHHQKRTPAVAIIGRPNVGKSTLFNRLLQERRAIVDDRPGITRDRNYGEVFWNGRKMTLVDTGGFVLRPEDPIDAAVRYQVEIAITEADLILFVVDRSVGVTDPDTEIARLIRESGKLYLLVVNKVDRDREMVDTAEFYTLGLGDPFGISALNGRLTGDLLDRIIDHLPSVPEGEGTPVEPVKVAVVGRPNVGKSTFVNAVLGYEKSIVDRRPGTTRDAIDSVVRRNGREYLLIDTAGLRRRARMADQVELACALRTRRSLERCDVAILLIDATDGYVAQDIRILTDTLDCGKGAIFAVNKWDLVERDEKTAGHYTQRLRECLPFADYVPILYTSGLTKQRVHKALDLAARIAENRRRRIPTPLLNETVQYLTAQVAPPSRKGKHGRIFYAVQQNVEPPAFLFFVNDPELILPAYRRYLEKGLREGFDFCGTPIKVILRQR